MVKLVTARWRCNRHVTLLASAASLVAIGSAVAQPPGSFPPIAPGATNYQVKPAEANGLVIGTLYLPKNFTLTVDPSVKSISWSVNKIVFEEGATIDLSAPQAKPNRAPNGASRTGQQGYCTPGNAGDPGGNGAAGAPGVDLTLTNVRPLESNGSLWIKTDGGPGGDGGNGGNGQLGGGHRSMREGIGKGGPCDSAPGGSGGRGGAGGGGGRPSKVTILFAAQGAVPPQNGVAPTCGPAQRPAIANGTSGALVIWGGPGCPGQKGQDGAHGGHG